MRIQGEGIDGQDREGDDERVIDGLMRIQCEGTDRQDREGDG